MIFLLAYLNIHYLILLSMFHEYAYFYEYIWKMVYKMMWQLQENQKLGIKISMTAECTVG